MTTKEDAQEYTRLQEEDQHNTNSSEREVWYYQVKGTPLFIRKKSVEDNKVIVTFMQYVLKVLDNEEEAEKWIKENTLDIALHMMIIVHKIETQNPTELIEKNETQF